MDTLVDAIRRAPKWLKSSGETVWKVVLGGYFVTLALMRKPYPTDLSDAEWKYIEPDLPAPKGFGRPRTHDLREILNAIFYLPKSGCQWRLLPHDFPRGGQPFTTTSGNGA
jgi:Putative transposase of IS4/5 family (DUF4096)